MYTILKPHGKSSRSTVRPLLSKAKLSNIYSILKPHGQSSRGPVRLLLSEATPSYCAHQHLNNYFRLHVCLSFRTSVRTYVRPSIRHTFIFLEFLQLFHKMSQIKVAWHVLRMKNMHPGSSSDPSGTAAAKAKPRCV